MVPSFASSEDLIKELICPQNLPLGSTPPGSGTNKRQRPESPSDEACLQAFRQRHINRKLPPTQSPPPQQFGYTPTSFTCAPKKSEVHVTEPDDHVMKSKFHPSSDVQLQNNGHARRNSPDNILVPEIFEEFDELDSWEIDINDDGKILTSQHLPHQDDVEDVLSLVEWDVDEKALDEILESPSREEVKEPPSSVIRAYDCESRSADEFDSSLQYSPLPSGSTLTLPSREYLPLEKGVDWTPMLESVRIMPKMEASIDIQDALTSNERNLPAQHAPMDSPSQISAKVTAPNFGPLAARLLLKPHKTFFHIQEMLDAKVQLFKNQPEVIFELFARVVYSNRENFHHKQYFQFRSLLKEYPPYINGTLIG